jgi:DNA-binding FadR family transcriptional regulator
MARHTNPEEERRVLTELRGVLLCEAVLSGKRLPPERLLARDLRASRAAVRKALAVLEEEGRIWRHVGQGTFLGQRRDPDACGLAAIGASTNPAEVLEARLTLEPRLASLAALRASLDELARMETCLVRSREAPDFSALESWDHRLHLTIARAAGNGLLLAFFLVIHEALQSEVWGGAQDGRADVRPARGL